MFWLDWRMTQAIAASEADLGASAGGDQIALVRKGVGEWLFLAPALVFFIGYQVWPIFRVLWLSFTDFQFLSTSRRIGSGSTTTRRRSATRSCGRASWRAALFTIMFLPGTIILPLLLAILVDRVTNQRLATLYRVILLIPAVIP